MKNIRISWTFLLAVIFAAGIFTGTMYASDLGAADGPAVFGAVSRETVSSSGGDVEDESAWSIDYIALNEDGTGVFLFNRAAFSIRWTQDGSGFSFTDHKGNVFTGTMDGARITGTYGRYRYTFEQTGQVLPVYTISPKDWGNDLAPVIDQADVLTDAQEEEYARRAQELADQYDVGVYVVLLDRMDSFTWSRSIETLSEEIRAGYSIGIGPTEKKEDHEKNPNADWKDSVLLTVVFDSRKYDICVSGDYADWAFPQYGREKNRDAFVDDFKENSWASGIDDYLDSVGYVLKVASKGHAISFRYDTAGRIISILVPILLALLFGYGISAAMRSSMKSAQSARNAAVYVAGDKVNFTRREDRYIRTVVSRVYSPREKSGGGGGHSSSGSSHTSGSF